MEPDQRAAQEDQDDSTDHLKDEDDVSGHRFPTDPKRDQESQDQGTA